MSDLTIISALTGGVIIGAASVLLLYKLNRVAGVSGIAAGILPPWDADSGWRLWFLLGLIASAVVYRAAGAAIPVWLDTSPAVLALAGLLVGYGARLGGGCTSGHGVCGLSRLSLRSLAATLTFMAAGFATVYITRHLLAWS